MRLLDCEHGDVPAIGAAPVGLELADYDADEGGGERVERLENVYQLHALLHGMVYLTM